MNMSQLKNLNEMKKPKKTDIGDWNTESMSMVRSALRQMKSWNNDPDIRGEPKWVEIPLRFDFRLKSNSDYSNIYGYIEEPSQKEPENKIHIVRYENYPDLLTLYNELKPFIGPGINIVIQGTWVLDKNGKNNMINLFSLDGNDFKMYIRKNVRHRNMEENKLNENISKREEITDFFGSKNWGKDLVSKYRIC